MHYFCIDHSPHFTYPASPQLTYPDCISIAKSCKVDGYNMPILSATHIPKALLIV